MAETPNSQDAQRAQAKAYSGIKTVAPFGQHKDRGNWRTAFAMKSADEALSFRVPTGRAASFPATTYRRGEIEFGRGAPGDDMLNWLIDETNKLGRGWNRANSQDWITKEMLLAWIDERQERLEWQKRMEKSSSSEVEITSVKKKSSKVDKRGQGKGGSGYHGPRREGFKDDAAGGDGRRGPRSSSQQPIEL